jgi:hypothetical protein
MGAEAKCRARVGRGKPVDGKALLETTELIFRSTEKGLLRVVVPYAQLRRPAAATKEGALELHTKDQIVTILDLGPLAAKWADKITNPPSLLEKLGVKPEQTILVIGVDDASFLGELGTLSAPKQADLIFFGVHTPADLKTIPRLMSKLAPGGALWVIRQKGAAAPVSEGEIRTAARAAGLIDVKVASFSPTHTADKYIVKIK